MRLYALALTLLLPCLAATPEIDKNKALGGPTAPIQMEVFSSFDCPHCKAFHEVTLPMLMRDYVVPGKVYLVFREFPLSGQYHPYAREAANYAVAAARIGKYQPVADALWNSQMSWATNGKVWDVVASVLTLPEQKKVQQFAKEQSVQAEVQREYDEGVAAGITGTPTIIVSHGTKRYPLPAQDLNYTFLRSLLDGMVK
jgi:protein-disulfide isomerase